MVIFYSYVGLPEARLFYIAILDYSIYQWEFQDPIGGTYHIYIYKAKKLPM